MEFQNTRAFAKSLDGEDQLSSFRNKFLFPSTNGEQLIYFCGNSLGLQPAAAREAMNLQLLSWQQRGVEAWFEGADPWLFYYRKINALLAPLAGTRATEVVAMNNLSVNLHLLMVSFYRPAGKKFKILMEAGAFPSDQYIAESQVKFHGYDPAQAIIEVKPKEGAVLLTMDDIEAAIHAHDGEIALVLFGGINYYTGQLYNLRAIAKAAHAAGAIFGLDLAHAIGNVPLELHEWGVDFACWCSYKYLNSGPGGIGGAFIHEKHFGSHLPRFAGWWGCHESGRFRMEKGYLASAGASGWQLSTSPILLLAVHLAALGIFEEAGGIHALREKSIRLTAYLEFVLNQVNREGNGRIRILSPTNNDERGCQLSLMVQGGKPVFDQLTASGIIADWREPNVIRLSPVPLYNSYEEVYLTGRVFGKIMNG